MKSKFIFSLFSLMLLAFVALPAQGNLQFNQVVKLEWMASIAPNGSGPYESFGPQNVTVPVGKVLKIESMNISINRSNWPAAYIDPQAVMNGSQSNEPPMLFLNNTVVHVNGEVNQAGISKTQIIWLPAGNYTFYMGARASSTVTQEFAALVTAIEFNVVP